MKYLETSISFFAIGSILTVFVQWVLGRTDRSNVRIFEERRLPTLVFWMHITVCPKILMMRD